MEATSLTSGTLPRSSGSALNNEAASCGRTAFLAPRTSTEPSSRLPPRITSRSMPSLVCLRPAVDYCIAGSLTIQQGTWMAPSRQPVRQAVFADRAFDGRRWHGHAAVLIENGRILGLAARDDVPDGCARMEAPAGTMLVPGFIDLQVNGGGGVLLNDAPTPEAMRAIARAHRRLGTTALLPTLITDTREQMQAAIASARAVAGTGGVLGLHLEGPFISPARPGVHRRDRILQADMTDAERLRDLPRRSMVTLAPECVPAGFVRALAASGARVSVGHSEASAEIVLRAADEGLTGVTHLYNAMPPLMGRSPGIVGAALSEPRLIAGLIADGIHVDPVSIRAAFAAKGADGI